MHFLSRVGHPRVALMTMRSASACVLRALALCACVRLFASVRGCVWPGSANQSACLKSDHSCLTCTSMTPRAGSPPAIAFESLLYMNCSRSRRCCQTLACGRAYTCARSHDLDAIVGARYCVHSCIFTCTSTCAACGRACTYARAHLISASSAHISRARRRRDQTRASAR